MRVRIFGDCITPALALSQTQRGFVCFDLLATLGLEGAVPIEGIRQNDYQFQRKRERDTTNCLLLRILAFPGAERFFAHAFVAANARSDGR